MLTRRQLLISALGIAGAGVAAQWLPFSLMPQDKRTRYLLIGEQTGASAFSLAVLALPDFQKRLIALPFRPHSFLQDAQHPELVWAFEKWGPHAAIVDIASARVVRVIMAEKQLHFSGHGMQVPGTRIVFASQEHQRTYAGHLTGYDMDTGSRVAMPALCKGELHEMRALPDGTVVAACSGSMGGKSLKTRGTRLEHSAIVHWDVRREQELGRATLDDDTQSIGHLQLLSQGRVLGLASNVAALVRRELPKTVQPEAAVAINQEGMRDPGTLHVMRLADYSLKTVELPAQMQSRLGYEMLSGAVTGEGGSVMITNPDGAGVLWLREADLTFERTLLMPALSVSADERQHRFLVGGPNGIFALDSVPGSESAGRVITPVVAGKFATAHSTIVAV